MSEFVQYREISNRLKKRFNLIRKPNLKESSESYRKLAQQLAPFPNYSGYCMYSAAKCEHQIVGSLKEQLNQSTNSITGEAQKAVDSQSNVSIRPSSSSSSSSSNRTNQALENLLSEALWTEFQSWLDTARIFSQTEQMEMDINGAISAYAHAIQTCPSPRMLTVVLIELASLYVKHQRFYEAAESFIEAGQFREAINCLLRGHFYQDAYHCYQEMFKKQPNFENFSNLTDVISTKTSSKMHTKTNPNATVSQQKSSILSLFKKTKQTNLETLLKSPDDSKSDSVRNRSCSKFPPFKVDGNNPFDFCENQLTIDDYITFFLLRLYLYDPVKYEYPSPIIPLPKHSIVRRFEDECDCPGTQELDDDSAEFGCPDTIKDGSAIKCTSSIFLKASELSLPFIDMINSSWMDRSIDDVIKLNQLLETLYLCYRNELRSSLDNEYSDYDIIQPPPLSSSGDEIDDDEMKTKPKELCKKHDSEESEETEFADEDSFSSIMGTSTRYDSKDSSDDEHLHPNKTMTVSAVGSSTTSPGLKLLETEEMDDISARLNFLAANRKTLSFSTVKKESIDMESIVDPKKLEIRIKEKLEQVEMKWISKNVSNESNDKYEEQLCHHEDDQDEINDHLRQRIARQLYPLLNCNQIQLLYDILREKE
ncbi:hypothetical protein BLA29_000731 [Euroglyphus maynei]|uniref:Uncharacterized protein n=1 Tax=Euroglyphus maynei TaxID=6958 RepID=A0A1Y3AZR4_EURMA|nr:hypothetical protein BLA29_000731 [Euroglyphus maynei]